MLNRKDLRTKQIKTSANEEQLTRACRGISRRLDYDEEQTDRRRDRVTEEEIGCCLSVQGEYSMIYLYMLSHGNKISLMLIRSNVTDLVFILVEKKRDHLEKHNRRINNIYIVGS